MKSIFVALMMLAAPETPDISKEDVIQARKQSFLDMASKMQKELPEGFLCHTSFHDDAEMAYWECEFAPTGRRLGSLWLWKNGSWGKIPGIFST